MSDFKYFSPRGMLEVASWKSHEAWPNVGLQDDCAKLQGILSHKRCSSLHDEDVLAWSPNRKGIYIVASRYYVLLSRRIVWDEVWW